MTNGTKVGGEIRVNATVANNQEYSSVAAVEGGYVVTWSSFVADGSDWNIYARRFGTDGTPLGGETLVNTTTNSRQIGSAAWQSRAAMS